MNKPVRDELGISKYLLVYFRKDLQKAEWILCTFISDPTEVAAMGASLKASFFANFAKLRQVLTIVCYFFTNISCLFLKHLDLHEFETYDQCRFDDSNCNRIGSVG